MMRALATSVLLAAMACGTGDPLRVVGTLERDRFELVAEAPEPIVEIAVREGDRVTRGALLVQLDDRRMQAQLARAESARNRAAARLAELQRGPRSEAIAEARARLAAAESSVATARLDLERVERLVARSVESQERRDQLRGRFDEAVARRAEALAVLERHLEGTTVEELGQAEASLAEAEAALTDVAIQAARLSVRAPVAGTVDALPFEIGERPAAGAVVAILLAEGAPYARVYVPEPVRVRVAPGTSARIHVDGLEGAFAGRVRTIARESAFTPYFALTERDRSRLTYVAEIDLVEPAASDLPTGVPVEAVLLPDRRVAAESDD
jgi:HlyD family secretion protein